MSEQGRGALVSAACFEGDCWVLLVIDGWMSVPLVEREAQGRKGVRSTAQIS